MQRRIQHTHDNDGVYGIYELRKHKCNSKTSVTIWASASWLKSPVPEESAVSWKEDMNSVIKKEGYSGWLLLES